MHIVRVDCKNGLHIEFGYGSQAKADVAVGTLQAAMGDGNNGPLVMIADDQGRRGVFLVEQLLQVMVVDVEVEVAAMVAQSVRIEQLKQEGVERARREATAGAGLLVPRPVMLGADGRPRMNGAPVRGI